MRTRKYEPNYEMFNLIIKCLSDLDVLLMRLAWHTHILKTISLLLIFLIEHASQEINFAGVWTSTPPLPIRH